MYETGSLYTICRIHKIPIVSILYKRETYGITVYDTKYTKDKI